MAGYFYRDPKFSYLLPNLHSKIIVRNMPRLEKYPPMPVYGLGLSPGARHPLEEGRVPRAVIPLDVQLRHLVQAVNAAAGQLEPGLVTRLDHGWAGQSHLGQAAHPCHASNSVKLRKNRV